MNILCWNCQGLWNPQVIHALNSLIESIQPSLIFLCKTKLSTVNFNKIHFKFGFPYSFVVHRCGLSGGLGLLWNNNLDVTLLSFSMWFECAAWWYPWYSLGQRSLGRQNDDADSTSKQCYLGWNFYMPYPSKFWQYTNLKMWKPHLVSSLASPQ